jgi:hypothetical protein
MAGVASISSILLAVEFSPGIHMDLRFAPLALAGMFGGPIAAALSASPASIFRVGLGGIAATDGVVAIVAVTGMGPERQSHHEEEIAGLLHVIVLGARWAVS